MFETVYRGADVTRYSDRAKLQRTTAMSGLAPLPSAVIAASIAPADAAAAIQRAIATKFVIEPARFRIPLGLFFLTGRISSSVAGSNIHLKLEASRVLWIAAIGAIAGLAALGSTRAAIGVAIALVMLIAIARVAAFRMFERIALSLPEHTYGGVSDDAAAR